MSAPVPPEAAVETVARALYEADHWAEEWDRAHEQIRENCRRLAAAAIAVLPPAEEAVERVEAVAADLQGEADSRSDDSLASVAERSGLLIAVTRLRAVLESPALPPSPAEEAVNVEGDWIYPSRELHARDLTKSWADAAQNAGCPAPFVARMRSFVEVHDRNYRAALASPAPAPQGSEGQR